MEETMESILAIVVPVVLAILALKIIWKLALNSLSGFICLWLLNLVSGITGIVFEINLLTTLIVGFLGIPGIVLLVIVHFLR